MDNNKEKDQFICPYANIHSCPPIADDEVNLLDILNVLWGRRLLILVITVLITGAASAYAFLSPKIYETKVNITPTSDLGIGMLLAEITSIVSIPATILRSETVYKNVLKNLQNRTVQAQFWDESEIVKRLNSGNETHLVNMSKTWFMQNLSVKLPSKKNVNQQVSISLAGGDPDVIVEVLNDFISYVNDYSGRAVIDNLKLKLAEKKLTIEVKIEMQRRNSERNIQRQIAELREQKAIAEKLKIIEMPEELAATPIYTRGVNALQTEMDILQQRKNSDLFIEDFSVLQVQLETIDEIDFSNVEISTMQAETALVSRQPKKPKQHLIVVLGLGAGVMLGIFLAFFVNFLQQVKSRSV